MTTSETLAERILVAEHRVYPSAVDAMIAGGWRVDGRRVHSGLSSLRVGVAAAVPF